MQAIKRSKRRAAVSKQCKRRAAIHLDHNAMCCACWRRAAGSADLTTTKRQGVAPVVQMQADDTNGPLSVHCWEHSGNSFYKPFCPFRHHAAFLVERIAVLWQELCKLRQASAEKISRALFMYFNKWNNQFEGIPASCASRATHLA